VTSVLGVYLPQLQALNPQGSVRIDVILVKKGILLDLVGARKISAVPAHFPSIRDNFKKYIRFRCNSEFSSDFLPRSRLVFLSGYCSSWILLSLKGNSLEKS